MQNRVDLYVVDRLCGERQRQAICQVPVVKRILQPPEVCKRQPRQEVVVAGDFVTICKPIFPWLLSSAFFRKSAQRP